MFQTKFVEKIKKTHISRSATFLNHALDKLEKYFKAGAGHR
jgi:hypothetical protein